MDLTTRSGRREQGQRIQRAVERAGLSIEELAGRIGCSRALIYQYLSGTTLAQPDRLQQIAVECAVPLIYFYSDADSLSDSGVSRVDISERRIEAVPALTTTFPPATEVAARLTDSLRSLQELAEAQDSSPDYRALSSTCERIVSLAAQVGDRIAQARAQERLGNALLTMGDNPRAADALSRAILLASEAGDVQSETIARQSLAKALIAMGRMQEARQQAEWTAKGPIFRGRWRGLLALGGIHEQFGEYLEAMQQFDEAATLLEEAEATGQASPSEVAVGLLYVNGNRRNVYLAGGDFRGARPLAEKCMADAEAMGNADQHLEARFDLAWTDFCVGRWSQAYQGWSTTLQLARFVNDQSRVTMVRAWLGIFLAAAGDHDLAIEHGKDALSLALSRGDRQAELYAQLALADAYTGLPMRNVEARYHTNQALAVTAAVRYVRSEIECRLRLARLCAQEGQLAELREASVRALSLSQRLGARHLESLARCWLAEALRRLQSANDRTASRDGETVLTSEPLLSFPETTARQEAKTALEMGLETEFVESVWRANYTLGLLALDENPTNFSEAEQHLRAAIAVLESLRNSLRDAGIPDTLLENADCADVYARLAVVLKLSDREDEAASFLEQTGWPPLATRVANSNTISLD